MLSTQPEVGCESSSHTPWPITTDALENKALGLNIFTVCPESLTKTMILIMELFTHLPSVSYVTD